MIAFLELTIGGFVLLTVLYFVVSVRARALRRGRLHAEWKEERRVGDRESFVEQGLRDYDGSLRRKLILGVYVIPVAVVAAIIYIVNFY